MVKQTMIHPYHGILLSNKKEQTTDTHNLNEFPGINAKWKKADPQKVSYCIISFI